MAQHKSEKAQHANNQSEQTTSTKSASSLNAADTNADKASKAPIDQRARPTAEKHSNSVTNEKAIQSSDSVDSDHGQVAVVEGSSTGKELPQTGKELPQVSQHGELPGENERAVLAESLNTNLLNIPAQVVGEIAQTEISSKVDQVLLDASKTVNVGQGAQGLDNGALTKNGSSG